MPPPAAPRRFETRSQKTICSLKCDHKQVGFLQEKREKRENTLVLKMPLSPLKMIPGMFQNNKTAISLQARKQSPQGHYSTSRATGKQGLGKPGEEDIGGGGGHRWEEEESGLTCVRTAAVLRYLVMAVRLGWGRGTHLKAGIPFPFQLCFPWGGPWMET